MDGAVTLEVSLPLLILLLLSHKLVVNSHLINALRIAPKTDNASHN